MANEQRQLEDAYRLHQQGRLDEAANLYESLIQQDPDNRDALHFFGVLKAAVGRFDEAKQMIERSLKPDASNLRYLENYVSILFQGKDYSDAANACATALAENRRSETLQYVMAVSFYKLGRLTEALDAFDALLRFYPHHLAGTNEKGATLAGLKRYDEALSWVDKALKINPRYAAAYLNRGHILTRLKKFDEAVSSYEKAISLNSKFLDAYLGLANAYRGLKRFDEALAAYQAALTVKPDSAEVWIGRGKIFAELERFEEALTAYDKALAIDQNSDLAWLGRGGTLFQLKDIESALAAFDAALGLNPRLAAAWMCRGDTLTEMKRYHDACIAYERATDLDPQLADAYLKEAVAKLCIGDFHAGWDLYEWRSKADEMVSAYPHLETLSVAARQERAAFIGKHVAVFSEQGIGDEIMFASMLPDLLADAQTVVYQVDPRLVRLFERSFPAAKFIGRGSLRDEQNLEHDFGMVIQAGSLGYAYRRSAASFPRLPYLRAEAARTDYWRSQIVKEAGAQLKVGLSWRGGTAQTRRDERSIDLEQLRLLTGRNDCYFVSLQYGNVDEELARLNNSRSGKVRKLLNDFNDFDELAALITALDIVVSVQNTTVHLCGALGKTCWGMIPWRPEWRYGADDKSMVWYSAVELFRQKRKGDWSDVIDAVNSNLAGLIGGASNGRAN